MKDIKAKLYLVISLAGLALVPTSALAQSIQEGATKAGGNLAPALAPLLSNIVNALIFVAGIVSVIVIIIGGFRYTTSQGNDKSVTAAKDTILYAVVGLVISILSFAIVNFVLTRLSNPI